MTQFDCALEKILVSAERFINDDGEPMSCFDVIESILKIFNCTIKQYKGQYYIENKYELDSFVHLYDYDTLAFVSRTATNRLKDISSKKFTIGVDQQKVRPLRGVKTTFLNKDLGGDITGVDLLDWTYVWNIHFQSYSINPDGSVSLHSIYAPLFDNYINVRNDFPVTKVSDYDYIKVIFDYKLTSSTPDLSSLPRIEIEVKRPDGVWYYVTSLSLTPGWTNYENATTFIKIESSGLYNIRLKFVPYYILDESTIWSSADFELNNMSITRVTQGASTESEITTVYDKYFVQTIGNGIKYYETETLLADSYQFSEVGVLAEIANIVEFNNYIITTKWNSFNGDEMIKIMDLYSRNILNDHSRFKNFLRFSMYDRELELNFNQIIIIHGRYYVWVTFFRDSLSGKVEGELIELITTKLDFPQLIRETQLKTINGKEV